MPPPQVECWRGRIAFLVKNLGFGGVQRNMLRVANQLVRMGFAVDLVTAGDGPLCAEVGAGVNMVRLHKGSRFRARLLAIRAHPSALRALALPVVLPLHPIKGLNMLQPLVQYLLDTPPDVLVSATANQNIVAALARRLARPPTALVFTERHALRQRRLTSIKFARRFVPPLMRVVYRDADAIIGVSDRVCSELASLLRIPEQQIQRIYNPAVPAEIEGRAAEPVDHPWFLPGEPPIVLSAGRMSVKKDYATLIRAFARAHHSVRARLVILSSAQPGTKQEGLKAELEALARSLGIGDDFAMMPFVANPFAYMAKSKVFALASITEGFGNVVAEALACGCRLVSTRTEGPVEVLDNGRFGAIVAIGDVGAMADALIEALGAAPDPLHKRRAQEFTTAAAARHYADACEAALAVRRARGG